MTPMIIPKRWINITSLEQTIYLCEDLEECSRVVVDCETTGLSITDEVFGVSIGTGDCKGDKKLRNVYWCNFNVVDEEVKAKVLEILRELFTSGKHNLMFHNASFDIKMIRATFDIPLLHENINDTMLLALVLCRWPAVGLKYLAGVVLHRSPVWAKEVEIFKTKIGFSSKDDNFEYTLLPADLIFPYACEDAENTFDLFFAVLQYYRYEPALLQDIYKLERRITRITARFEFEGMCIDLGYFQVLHERLKTELAEEMKYYKERWGEYKDTNKRMVPSIHSHTKLAKILFEPDYPDGLRLPIEMASRTKTGAISSKMDELAVNFPDNEDIQRLSRYTFRKSAFDDFTEPILTNHIKWINDDGSPGNTTIHTEFWQIQSTGRFGSSHINLQNITNDKLANEWEKEYSIRSGFIAPEGYLYLTADFKAFEVAILANASQDSKLIKHVTSGVDFHSIVGSMAYHRPYEELRNHVDDLAFRQRTTIKRTSFAFLYGAGVPRIARTTGISIEEAQRIKNALSDAYPEMMTWWERTYKDAASRGKIYTLCGRVRRIPSEKAYVWAVNTVCQGTGADVLKYAHADLEVLLQGTKSRQVHTVHDEIHFYIHPDDVDMIPKIVDVMQTRRFNPPNNGMYVPLMVELSAGSDWSHMHGVSLEEVENLLLEMKNART